jgi:hypothetical protein
LGAERCFRWEDESCSLLRTGSWQRMQKLFHPRSLRTLTVCSALSSSAACVLRLECSREGAIMQLGAFCLYCTHVHPLIEVRVLSCAVGGRNAVQNNC